MKKFITYLFLGLLFVNFDTYSINRKLEAFKGIVGLCAAGATIALAYKAPLAEIEDSLTQLKTRFCQKYPQLLKQETSVISFPSPAKKAKDFCKWIGLNQGYVDKAYNGFNQDKVRIFTVITSILAWELSRYSLNKFANALSDANDNNKTDNK